MPSPLHTASPATPSLRLGVRDVIDWAVWFGAATALGQTVAVNLVREFTTRTVFITRDIVWRAPLSNVVLYALIGLLLAAIMRRASRTTSLSVLVGLFMFLAAAGPILQVPRLHPYAALFLAAGVAVQAGRLTLSHPTEASRFARQSLPWLAVPCALLAVGFLAIHEVRGRRALSALPAAAPGAPNVILIVLDTVRSASLNLYGYQRPTTPHLTTFARSGVVFEHAFAPAPWTLPSHATMFTGRLPTELSADWRTPLDARQPTIGEVMQSRGYVTVGEVANLLYTTSSTGLDRGFVRYSDFPMSVATLMHQSWLVRPIVSQLRRGLEEEDKMVRKSAAEVTDDFVDWLDDRSEKPFFAFLNYFDAHAPYLPPAPYDRIYGGDAPLPDLARRRQWSPAETQRSLDAYEGALAYIDTQLQRLFEALAAQRLLDNTVLIVTSDHGEQFGEHNLFDHANSLYRAVLEVPLIVSFPAKVPSGVRVTTPVSLVDVPGTILDLAGIGGGLPGRSLAAHWTGAAPMAAPVFSEVSKGINLAPHLPVSRGRMLSVVLDGVHYIRNGDGVEELYDFERDALETTNLASLPEMQPRLEAARSAVDATLRRK